MTAETAFKSAVACAALALLACLAVTLAQSGEPEAPHQLSYVTGGSPRAIVLNKGPDGSFAVRLISDKPGPLFQARQVTLLLGTHGATPVITTARLTFAPHDCSFVATGSTPHQDNAPLTLTRTGRCEWTSKRKSIGGRLDIQAPEAAALAIWGMAATKKTGPVTAGTLATVNRWVGLTGTYLGPPPPDTTLSRWQLVRHVWSLPTDVAAPVSWVFAAALVLFGTGTWCFFANRPATGLASLFAAMTVFYAVVVPPFQAPDEPDHFLEFAAINKRPDLKVQALALANRGHFERLKFHPAERLTTADTQASATDREWAGHIKPRSSRYSSPFARALWRAEYFFVQSWGMPTILLALRLVNGALVAFCFGLVLWFLDRTTSERHRGRLVGIGILAIPTLPFFSMHFSDYAPLIGTYLLLGGVGASCVIRQRVTPMPAALLGLTAGIAFVSSRSATRVIAAVVPLLTLGFMIQDGAAASQLGTRLRHAGWCLLATFLGFHLAALTGATPFLTSIERRLPYPLWMLDLLFMTTVTGAAFLGIWARYGDSLAGVRARLSGAKWLWRSAGVLLCAFLMIGALFKHVTLPNIEGLRAGVAPEHARYAYLAVKTFLTSLPLSAAPDFYVSASFWGGFGWLETIPPAWFLTCVKALTTVGLISVLVQALRRGAFVPRHAWLGIGVVAVLGWVYTLGIASSIVGFNLHGRYLIGAYLVLQVLAFIGLSDLEAAWLRRHPRQVLALPATLLVAAFVIHAYCLTFVLNRYF